MRATAEETIAPGAPREEAIPRLIALHGEKLYRMALRLCGNPQDAEDLAQETFLQAYRKWEQFDGRSKVTTWLYTIAARKCGRMRRLRAGEPKRIESLDELMPFEEKRMAHATPAPRDPAAQAEHRDLQRRMEESIAGLPALFRIPLVMKDIFEMPISEVAEVLGLKPETVKSRVHRARLHVRRDLARALPAEANGPPAAYPKQVCLDLLQAKQEALDRGVAFPVRREIVCERCRSIFETMDLAHQVCGELDSGRLPEELRRKLLAQVS